MTENEIRAWPEVIALAGAKLVPGAGESLHMLLDQVFVRRRASASQLVGEITTAAGGVETLALRLANPEIEALFIDGFETAMRTSVAAKRRLLAEVIANAVSDDAKVDSSQLYVMALRDLEAPHIRALARLAAIVRELRPQMPSDVTKKSHFVNIANEKVRLVWNGEPSPIQAALVRTGCVQLQRGFLESGYEITQYITEFGFELLDHIERHGGVNGAERDN